MKRLFDMKTIRKFQFGLLFLGMMLTASCSTDVVHDEMTHAYYQIGKSMDDLDARVKLLEQGMGTFEGRWKFYNNDYNYVDNDGSWTSGGSIAVQKDTISFVLPEEMITDLFWLGCASYPDVTWADTYPDEPFFSDYHSINYGYQLDSLYGQWVCSKTVQQLTYNLEGLTVESYYLVGSNASNSFANEDSYGIRANIPLPEYGDYSYMISKDDLKYRIDLRINNETLVFYKETATWYLQMPIKKITLTNLQTGNQVAAEFKDDVRIFMNTYSKIE